MGSAHEAARDTRRRLREELELYVKLYLTRRNAGDDAILEYLDEAGMEYVQSRRLMREKGFGRGEEEENGIDEVVEGIRKFEIARGRVSWRAFPVRN
jgi:hypothetical protein